MTKDSYYEQYQDGVNLAISTILARVIVNTYGNDKGKINAVLGFPEYSSDDSDQPKMPLPARDGFVNTLESIEITVGSLLSRDG